MHKLSIKHHHLLSFLKTFHTRHEFVTTHPFGYNGNRPLTLFLVFLNYDILRDRNRIEN